MCRARHNIGVQPDTHAAVALRLPVQFIVYADCWWYDAEVE